MTDREIRAAVFEHIAMAGALIRVHSDPEAMQSMAADDLYDACRVGSPVGLREAFTDAARDFWLRDNLEHSVKVPPKLTVVP
jgi:hypothetical protein